MINTKVTIIIPIYNEEKFIKEIVNRVNQKVIFKKQIILVDDFSTDGTRAIIKKLENIDKIIFHNKNLGKGAAIKSAIPYIKGEIVAIQDADLEYAPKDLNRLIHLLISKNLMVIYGSRVLNKNRYDNEFISNFRTFGNQVLTLISNLLNNQRLTDAHTCYKVFTSKIFFKLKLKEDDFAFCPEVNTKLSLMNVEIFEEPISYKGRTVKEGKKINFYDAIRALYTIIKYRLF